VGMMYFCNTKTIPFFAWFCGMEGGVIRIHLKGLGNERMRKCCGCAVSMG
jgi:hypothetical protein